MDLAAAVAPTTLARQRTLPVADPLQPLLPEGALARGRTVSCRGVAATSLAVALAAEATIAGAWLAVVDVPWLGVEAVAELGVPLERLVRVDPGETTGSFGGAWADLVAAVLDGFELVVTRVPRRVSAGHAAAGADQGAGAESVLIAVGEPGPLDPRHRPRGVDAGVGGRRRRAGATYEAGGSPSPRPAGGSRARVAPSCGCPVPAGSWPPSRSRCNRWPRAEPAPALRGLTICDGRAATDGHRVVPGLARRRGGCRRRTFRPSCCTPTGSWPGHRSPPPRAW